MKITIQPKIANADALFIFVPETKWKANSKAFDKKIISAIEDAIKDESFQAKKGFISPIVSPIKEAKKAYLVGLGELKNTEDIRKAAGTAIKMAKKTKAKSVGFLLPSNIDAQKVISGVILGDYEFKVGDISKRFSPTKVNITTDETLAKATIDQAIALAESTNLVRDLINLPPNLMTPKILAGEAKKIGKGIKSLVKVKVLGVKEMTKLGMGSLLNVGVGSDEESQLIVFEYNGGKKDEKPLALIGKGVCFDAGGYNLKPTGHIEEMKSDMSGAATVVGMFDYIAKTKPNKNIVGVIGAVENLINGKAFKPGDIITAMNGSTIEVTNTDAEGRLVLADCLYYAATKLKPAKMIDLATLTGACIAALGFEMTAIMGNDKVLIKELQKASEVAGEDTWELPITDLFREKIKGDISDLVNWSAGVSAGSSMGGAFLDHFVEETPWVHIDIAGTSFHGKYGDAITPKGATGVMMRTLKELIEA